MMCKAYRTHFLAGVIAGITSFDDEFIITVSHHQGFVLTAHVMPHVLEPGVYL
jgi:hypothetical protein